jgi:hypothetical protein
MPHLHSVAAHGCQYCRVSETLIVYLDFVENVRPPVNRVEEAKELLVEAAKIFRLCFPDWPVRHATLVCEKEGGGELFRVVLSV